MRTFDRDNIFDYGLDRMQSELNLLLDAHNSIVNDLMGTFVEQTTDRIRRYGDVLTGELIEVDEYGAADVQKAGFVGVNIGFPLRAYQRATGWTQLFFESKTPADMAKEFIAMRDGDLNNLRRAIQRALYTSTNNLNYIDRRVDGMELPLRAMLNADSTPISPDPFGAAFNGASHTHYLASATFTDAVLQTAVDTVIEHGLDGGQVRIYINRAQEAAVAGFASFDAYLPERIRPGGGATADVALGGTLDNSVMDNHAIGLWDGYAEVWIKPWCLANYVTVLKVGASGGAVIAMRTRPFAGAGGLRVINGHTHLPMSATTWQREFGMSAWNRSAGAILQMNNGTYQIPTIT
jgi:hypothetical protein